MIKKGGKRSNNKIYNNNNKTKLKISIVRGEYLYSRAKPRSINLNIMQ